MSVNEVLQFMGLLGLLVIAAGIATLNLPWVAAGVFLLVAPEVVTVLRGRGGKK